MSETQLERSVLEAKEREELFAIADALGAKPGARAKKASSFIVMAIMGGALLPKLMGSLADKFDVSRSFIVPACCFAIVAAYGFG